MHCVSMRDKQLQHALANSALLHAKFCVTSVWSLIRGDHKTLLVVELMHLDGARKRPATAIPKLGNNAKILESLCQQT
jgi:hypothetical protein